MTECFDRGAEPRIEIQSAPCLCRGGIEPAAHREYLGHVHLDVERERLQFGSTSRDGQGFPHRPMIVRHQAYW
jgi:hypothetical protein